MCKSRLCFLVFTSLSILIAADKLFPQDRAPLHPSELSFSALPLTFEPNQGQTDANARFLARSNSYAIFLESNKTVLVVPRQKNGHESSRDQPSLITLELLKSDKQAASEGLNLLPGKSNYFVGSKRAKWISGIPQYGKVKFKSIYPGIDLVYYGGQGQLE